MRPPCPPGEKGRVATLASGATALLPPPPAAAGAATGRGRERGLRGETFTPLRLRADTSPRCSRRDMIQGLSVSSAVLLGASSSPAVARDEYLKDPTPAFLESEERSKKFQAKQKAMKKVERPHAPRSPSVRPPPSPRTSTHERADAPAQTPLSRARG